jgi:hypothetical protein
LHWQFLISRTLQVNFALQRGQFFSSPAFIHKCKLYFVIVAKHTLCSDVDFEQLHDPPAKHCLLESC